MTQRPHVSRETATGVAHRTLSAASPGLTGSERDRLALLVGLVCSTPVGITAIRDPAEAAARHVLDALAGLPAIDAAPAGALADVGSGGGLPGLVLATVRPERETHLIEATARKAAFIAEAAAALGLHVHVHARRSEELGRGELARRLRVRRGAGSGAPARGRRALPPALPARRAARAVVARVRPATSSPSRPRALGGEVLVPECPGVLVIGKREATPERFPRRPGMAAKRPLSAPRSDRRGQ